MKIKRTYATFIVTAQLFLGYTLLNRNRLSQIPRLINVGAFEYRDVVGQQL